MKNKHIFKITILIFVLFQSCAFHKGIIYPSTVIDKPNFKIINTADGYSKATYFFGLGGIDKNGLYNDAKKNLYSKINLKNNQSIANITVDEKSTTILFYMTKEVFMTADIIEFFNDNLINSEKVDAEAKIVKEKTDADAKAKDDAYKAAIAKADVALGGQKYDEAKKGYNEAFAIKPNEQYPKTKIEEIDKLKNNIETKLFDLETNNTLKTITYKNSSEVKISDFVVFKTSDNEKKYGVVINIIPVNTARLDYDSIKDDVKVKFKIKYFPKKGMFKIIKLGWNDFDKVQID